MAPWRRLVLSVVSEQLLPHGSCHPVAGLRTWQPRASSSQGVCRSRTDPVAAQISCWKADRSLELWKVWPLRGHLWKPPQLSFSPRRKSAEVTRSRWCCCLQGPSLLFICIAALSLIDTRRLPHLQPHILVTGRKKQSSKKKK